MFGIKKLKSKERKAERYPTFNGAEVYGTHTKFRCAAVVRDISETGARLRLTTNDTPPDHITIRVTGYDDTMKGKICWRNDGEVGVMFDEPLKAAE
ncbi:MAG TPA: PilZ domain-containing protein [Afifellaceae bacterium]|jgi:hypothetical protein|nr:PilZ domain-containing protein [Afifellaceae bacterium]